MPTVQGIKAGLAVKAPVAKASKVAKNVVAKSTAKVAEGNKGAEALSNQGRAMVHYTKPSAQEIKMENPKSLKATSGWGGGGDQGGFQRAPETPETPETDMWGNTGIWG